MQKRKKRKTKNRFKLFKNTRNYLNLYIVLFSINTFTKSISYVRSR